MLNNSKLRNQTIPTKEYDVQVESWETLVVAIALTPIIVLGVLGNLFSLFVWVKGRRRQTSTAKYLSALAMVDMMVLLTAALEFWIYHVLHFNLRETGTFACKFLSCLSFLTPAISAWILVSVTIERALSVWIPHRISVSCRPVTAVVITCVLSFLLFLVYLPIIVGVDVVKKYTQEVMWLECTALRDSIYAKYINIWFYVDLCIFFAGPFMIMLLCNISIIAKVVCLAKKRNASLHEKTDNTKVKKPTTKSAKMLKTVTRRVVILCVAYCVCNGPLSILNVLLVSSNASSFLSAEDVQYYRIPFNVLMYLNNGINFLLYCMIGSSFRKDFIGIFRPSSRTSTTR